MRELTLGGSIEEIPRAAAWLAGLADQGLVSHALLYEMQLCLEEALANTITHGFTDVAQPRISLCLSEESRHLKLEIADNGSAFDPTKFSLPPVPDSLEEAQPGGHGIALMRQFCAGMSYDREADRNRLTLLFDR